MEASSASAAATSDVPAVDERPAADIGGYDQSQSQHFAYGGQNNYLPDLLPAQAHYNHGCETDLSEPFDKVIV